MAPKPKPLVPITVISVETKDLLPGDRIWQETALGGCWYTVDYVKPHQSLDSTLLVFRENDEHEYFWDTKRFLLRDPK